MGNIPDGIDQILAMAAVDRRFLEILLKNQDEAIKASGVVITETEKTILDSTDNAALGKMIERVGARIPQKERAALGRCSTAALAMLIAAGVLAPAVLEGCCTYGISPVVDERPKVVKDNDPEMDQFRNPEPHEEPPRE
jgi:hypothetical protein